MRKWYLPLILALAFVLRIVALDKYPIGFTPDEASFGYDAYSLLETGKDQWGSSWPLVFKSFGDYKAPIYTYLAMPFVALLDLTKVSVRLPNALLGVGAIYVVFLLVRELFKDKEYFSRSFLKMTFPEITALIFAISPWHIMMSRGAFEANLITFFLPLGIYLFLKNKYYLSMFVFGLSLFTYHSAKLVTPLVVILLFIFFKSKLSKVVSKSLVIFGVFLVLSVYTVSIGAGARIAERSITQGALEEGAKIKIDLIQKGMNPIVARLLHNKYQVVASRFVKNYVQYFSPKFLLIDGPAETTYGMVKGMGVLSYIEILGLIALVFLFKESKVKKILMFLLCWLLIAPLPASLSTGVGYAGNRAVSMIPVVQILSAIGIYSLLSKYKLSKYFVSILILVGLGVFTQKYFIDGRKELSKGMLHGNLEIATQLYNNSVNYDEIIISKKLSEPHIYIAFAGKIDPGFYQAESKNWKFEEIGVNWVDQIPEYRLGKFTFK